ncbi:MAG TPA: discoidin domain-containing protein, partial [Nitrososphaera sp.]
MKHLEKKSGVGRRIEALSLAGLLAVSFVGTTSIFAAEHADAASSTCEELTIVDLRASSDDGNVPENTLDSSLNTRWSGYGIGSWITADLGAEEVVCSVDIAWYRGDERVNHFVISVSSDGTSFTDVYSGESSGQTTSFEKYALQQQVPAGYIKITVNGNTMNRWASITEIDVNREEDDTSKSGGDSGDDMVSTGVDKFGIRELYPTKPGGDEWFMNMDNPNADEDRFTTKDEITKNPDGSWKVEDGQ